MAGSFGSMFRNQHADQNRRPNRSVAILGGQQHPRPKRRGMTGAVVLSAAVLALAVLALAATPASAQGLWTVTISGTSGATTTGVVVNGSVTPNGDAGSATVLYEPSGTPITSSSPTAGLAIFSSGDTTPQAVSLTVDQLTPNTSYVYELQATDDTNDATYDSSQGTFSTTASPTGSGTPIVPPNNPASNGIFGQCESDAACVNDMNGVRANQEQHAPLTLPSNWSTLTQAEQLFVWTNLERTSRGEVAITNLVNTYAAAVQGGITNDQDPSLSNLPGNSTSIWAGAFPTVLGGMYAWMYDDGWPGSNSDCTSSTAPGCWGHRNAILGDSDLNSSYGNPTEMDAEAGTDSGGNIDYAAIFVVNPNPTAPANIVFTWAQEQSFIGSEVLSPPSISGVTLSGTPADPTVTVTGSNFGSGPPASTPETCQSGDTGDDFGWGGLVFQDLSHGWGGGEAGNCIGLLLTSWSNTQVVFTFGNQYANYGPMNPGDQVEATIQGATDTVTASFPNLPSIASVTLTGTAANPTVTVSGSNFGSNPPTGTPETCQSGDTGDDYGSAGLILQDTTESWGAGQSGDCIGLLLTSWSNTQVVFTVGNEYAHYGPIAVGDQIKVTVQGATDTVTASFSTPVVPTVTAVSPTSGPSSGGTAITITGTGFIAGAKVTVGQGSGAVTGAISATSVTVVSSTKITAVTGGGAKAGTWSLFVTTSGGTSAANTSDNFTYNAASVVPTVTTVSPNSGSTAGRHRHHHHRDRLHRRGQGDRGPGQRRDDRRHFGHQRHGRLLDQDHRRDRWGGQGRYLEPVRHHLGGHQCRQHQ